MADNIAKSLGDKYINKNFAKPVFAVLLFLILFFSIIAFFYYNTTKKVEIIWNETLGLFNRTEKIIMAPSVLTANSLKESYILYMTVDNAHGNMIYNFTSSKHILRRRDESFQINYKPKTNHLSIVFKIKKLKVDTPNSQNEYLLDMHNTEQAFDIPGIPYQKWFQLAVIIDGRNVDVYINKLLVRNYTIDNIPMITNEDIILGENGNNPNIYIGRIEYSPSVLTLNEIRALHYKNMPNLHLSAAYRQQMVYEGRKFIEDLHALSPSGN